MRVTSKGQVTIPQSTRDATGLRPGVEVDVVLDQDGRVVIRRKAEQTGGRGDRLVAGLRKLRPRFTLTTQEIMKLTRGED